jgi:hypothetical protein
VSITTDVMSSNPTQGKVYNLCDNVCQWIATGRWFSQSTLVSSTNKTDCHIITEILLKVALSTIKTNQTKLISFSTTKKFFYQDFILYTSVNGVRPHFRGDRHWLHKQFMMLYKIVLNKCMITHILSKTVGSH